MVERCGVKLKSILWRENPWGGVGCDVKDCPVCEEEEGDRDLCKQTNIIYTNTCKTCKEQGVNTKYIGETSRTLAERALEHHRDRVDTKKTSHMREHEEEQHQETGAEFRFDVVK